MCARANMYGVASALIAYSSMASASYAEATINIILSGEAYEGAPVFELSLGDKTIGRGELTKAIDTVATGRIFQSPEPERYLEHFRFTVPDADFHADRPVTMTLVNDKFTQEGWGHDRNLFIHSIEVNGSVVRSAQLKMMNGDQVQPVTYQLGLLPIYHQNDRAVAMPPEGGWPTAASARTSRLLAKPATAVDAGG